MTFKKQALVSKKTEKITLSHYKSQENYIRFCQIQYIKILTWLQGLVE